MSNIDRGQLQKLHALMVAVYEELHHLDGTETGGYVLFNNPKWEQAAKLNHLMYSQAVIAMERKAA